MPATRRIRFQQLESRQMLSVTPWDAAAESLDVASHIAVANPWHNVARREDVNADGRLSPLDALLVINDLNLRGSRPLLQASGESPATAPTELLDVNGDGHVSPVDVLIVINALNAEAESGHTPVIEVKDVKALLNRAAAASASEGAIIAVVDRGGRILGIRAEQDVLDTYAVDTLMERTEDFIFAVDGAVAKARTAAFFANGDGPLTSRTVRFISQSTITQREVESNPNIGDPDSPLRGPGFVAPIGVGGHFPPGIAHTPLVDLFAIEHTNRDSLTHPGPDGVVGTADDIVLAARFNANFAPGIVIEAPESYGVVSGRLPDARSRGIATLPGGMPLYKRDPYTNAPILVGGIGVFFPGPDGFATYEQGFIPGVGQTELARTNAPKVLEAEWIAFAAACGSSGAGAAVGDLGGVPCPAGYDLPFGRIDLVGIRLEIYGPHPTTARPQSGARTLLDKGAAVGIGNPASGEDQFILPGVFHRAGVTLPDGWLVLPQDSPTGEVTAAEVEQIINQAIAEADLVRAAIRLPIGQRTRMAFSVADREGNVLGLYRMPDSTFFSLDVAVAKSRNTAYYADSTAIVAADRVDPSVPAGAAFTNRTFRFLAAPRYPTGAEGTPPGPFSILVDPGINPVTGENLGPALPASVYASSSISVLGFSAFNPGRNFRDPDHIENQNGVVFFPGSSPIYKNGILVGGFGASGDGVDQDDVVTYSATVGFQAPTALRADQYFVRDVRLPFQKFLRNPRG